MPAPKTKRNVEVIKMYKMGVSPKGISKMFKVSIPRVHEILYRKRSKVTRQPTLDG